MLVNAIKMSENGEVCVETYFNFKLDIMIVEFYMNFHCTRVWAKQPKAIIIKEVWRAVFQENPLCHICTEQII